jgi:hypothetical protein
MATDGMATDGMATDGIATDGMATDGMATDGMATDGMAMVPRMRRSGAEPRKNGWLSFGFSRYSGPFDRTAGPIPDSAGTIAEPGTSQDHGPVTTYPGDMGNASPRVT